MKKLIVLSLLLSSGITSNIFSMERRFTPDPANPVQYRLRQDFIQKEAKPEGVSSSVRAHRRIMVEEPGEEGGVFYVYQDPRNPRKFISQGEFDRLHLNTKEEDESDRS